MKRHYRPNRILKDERLPFELEITSGLSVYYRTNNKYNRPGATFKKADQLYCDKTHKISVSIDNYLIDILGTDKKGNFVYKIFKDGKALINETDKI